MNTDLLWEVAKPLVPALAAVALAWAVGNRLSAKWGLWQKRREQAHAAANDFYRLYGEFFAVWKLWNYSLRQADADGRCQERCRFFSFDFEVIPAFSGGRIYRG